MTDSVAIIGAKSTEEELASATAVAHRHLYSGGAQGVSLGLRMLAAIAAAWSDAVELAGQRVMFKSVRAA